MKKNLFILILISISLIIKGQGINGKKGILKSETKISKQLLIGTKENSSTSIAPKYNNKQAKNNSSYGNLHSYFIMNSVNMYTLLVPYSTCLTANQALNTIMFTCRDDHFTDVSDIPNNIISSYRINTDTIWKAINITSSAPRGDRYPSGVIYNPTGNTNPLHAYSVITGPIANGNNGWTGNFFGSGRLDNTNNFISNVSKATYMQDMVRDGLASCDDGRIHVLGFDSIRHYSSNVDSFKLLNVVMNNGKFDTTNKKVVWSHVKIKPAFYNHNVNGNVFNTAWSQDGNTGYVYFFGVDSIYIHNAYQPIVFKSTDKGASWNQLDDFDFRSLQEITSRLYPIHFTGSYSVPSIIGNEADAVVDSTGNLHIFTLIQGSVYDNKDSMGYYYVTRAVHDPYDVSVLPALEQKIFDLYTKSDGTWGAQFVDSLHSQLVTITDALGAGMETGTTSLAVGWDHRLQASRTASGGKIFLTWADDDTLSTKDVANLKPNLIVYGKDIRTGLRAKKNFTLNIPYFDSKMLFNYTGDITLKDNDNYHIPITYSTFNSSGDPSSPPSHYYLDGVYFNEKDFVKNVGVKEITDKNAIKVSQNYPNPFKGKTTINVYLPKQYTISVEVRNLVGQKVYEIPAKSMSAGNHTIIINGNNLTAGIYFYTIKANQFAVTKKMVVR